MLWNHPVIIPADCVDTYDISVEAAEQEGIPPHPADLLHTVFLYNMERNGIKFVSYIDYGDSVGRE